MLTCRLINASPAAVKVVAWVVAPDAVLSLTDIELPVNWKLMLLPVMLLTEPVANTTSLALMKLAPLTVMP